MQQVRDMLLIAQVVASGSERAFGQLVERHQEAVRRFLLRLTGGDAMRADDLAQETFIRVWQGIAGFRRLSGFRTWVLSIAYRVYLDDERRPQQPSAELPDTCADDARADDALLRHDIDMALAVLSEAERTCVVLQCVEGMSIRDIAAVTSLPENSVKSHLLRGKKAMAAFLRRNGYA